MTRTNGTPPYTVIYPPAVLDLLQRWADQAARDGHLPEFAPILLALSTELPYHPTRWGDPLWTAANGNVLYARHHRLMAVTYEVDPVGRVVRVTRVFLPPGSPLAGPEGGP